MPGRRAARVRAAARTADALIQSRPQEDHHPSDANHQQQFRKENRKHPLPSMVLTTDEILKVALNFVGFEYRQDVTKDENLRRFRAFFGIGPQAAGKVYADLIQTSKSFELKYFFLTLNWLKSYDTELILSGWWRMHEQSIRQSVWSVSTAIQNLKDKKVSSFWESPAIQNPSHFLHRPCILSLGCVWQL